MCVAIIKPKTFKLPDDQTLRACWHRNPHGGGFAYSRGGRVHWVKGLMTVDEFVKAVRETIKDSDTAFIHVRYATHGGGAPGLTHPFPVVTDFAAQRELTGEADAVLMHNGVMHWMSSSEEHVSDSMEFTKLVAQTRMHVRAEGKAPWKAVMERQVDGSRVAVLWADGAWSRYGLGWGEWEGCWYSNFHWYVEPKKKERKPSTKQEVRGTSASRRAAGAVFPELVDPDLIRDRVDRLSSGGSFDEWRDSQ